MIKPSLAASVNIATTCLDTECRTTIASPIYINACGFISALGSSTKDINQNLLAGNAPGLIQDNTTLVDHCTTFVGRVTQALPSIPTGLNLTKSRNNQLALAALLPCSDAINQAKERYGSHRIAVVVGTSTSGIDEGGKAIKQYVESGQLPDNYSYKQQELGDLAHFIANYFGLDGPAYVISTACSSSGRAFISAQRLLNAGLVDAVVVGGADSLCGLTLNGFHALEALSQKHTQPFGQARDGINIGEAAAFMLVSNERNKSSPNIALLGAGESSDAYHISAPHPEGRGAIEAMHKALNSAGLHPEQVGYINAHGTATPLNDQVESKAIHHIFADNVPVSSTKRLTGHTLGAASAVEAAISYHILRYDLTIPAQSTAYSIDQRLPPIQLAKPDIKPRQPIILSNSFAFGGNNVSLIFGEVS
ncbi:beta-ketoacyl-[acyl-carrier-protein] synthase family protein [Thaumasiovibrio sp. DFM-14]|uniref:beta-ketoacyl-[acyl-carrier-protein] synthase family protein n=1 Tax=Thaumasiovibrio sp. DFM-14 TaxID=3384792 RepID=UPI0039A071E5